MSLDPLGPECDSPLGSKDLEEEEGPWGGGSGLPPPGCFHGSWRHDVALDCKGSPEGAEARAWTVYYYSLLQSCLQQAGLPETQDRTQVPRTGCPGAEVTLCILGSPSTFLSLLLEGGVQSPGNMLLCLSPAWLTKVPAPGQPGEAALLVSKAVSFHPGGLTFLDDFVPPRRATYFLAGLGLGPGWGELARLLEDRLLTRRLLAQQGDVVVPATLAFTYKPPALLRGGDASPGLRLVELNGKEDQETLVKEEVGAFLHSEALGDALQAMRLYPRAELGPVVDTVLALLEKLEEEESVLVEAVCPPARLPFPGSPPPGPELALRICAVVCRTQGDRPLLSKLHLVESDPNHFASQLVQTFIHFDITEHQRDEENARVLAELELGLPCNPPAAMHLAKQKSHTQLHLLCRHGPPWPAPSLYAVPCCPLESEADGEADYPGIGLGWGNAMLLMEFIEGTEHDVDLLTRAGPRLIEINPRMGGFYLRDWIQELYGVDLLLAATMVACGLRPALPAHPRARGHLVGVMCLVSQHLQALSSTASRETLQALHDQGLLRLNLLEEALVPGEYEEPYCSVACAGSSPAEARLRLLGLCQGLGIDGPHYPVAYFLSHFK
ncbi:hypothetical protein E2I00_011607 [Balaenoptera physalus]|uniref:ATP-grasp domain-containing protein n=1 Tax=Balaenoptera physalus TaxID=9770 RepID=A0A643BQB3_BALPH|nr:hypothetical protein E2I00_011607 [Balaenoptera physalus]